jgi:hypothetical protein
MQVGGLQFSHEFAQRLENTMGLAKSGLATLANLVYP